MKFISLFIMGVKLFSWPVKTSKSREMLYWGDFVIKKRYFIMMLLWSIFCIIIKLDAVKNLIIQLPILKKRNPKLKTTFYNHHTNNHKNLNLVLEQPISIMYQVNTPYIQQIDGYLKIDLPLAWQWIPYFSCRAKRRIKYNILVLRFLVSMSPFVHSAFLIKDL